MVASRTLLVGAIAVTAHCPSSLELPIRVELRTYGLRKRSERIRNARVHPFFDRSRSSDSAIETLHAEPL